MPKAKSVIVLHVKVGQEPETKTIDGGLKSMQDLVGGYIECVGVAPGVDVFCNEEGKVSGLPWNVRATQPVEGDIIAGDFFVCRHNNNGGSQSLNAKDIEKYTALYKLP